jgi:hypothetical protein
MRTINSRQFLKILKGEDLEFRISQYPVRLVDKVKLEDLHFPYDIHFRESVFQELSFRNCRFSGDLSFSGSKIGKLSLRACDFRHLSVKQTEVLQFEVKKSVQAKSVTIGASAINSLVIEHNEVFESIELGCENHIMQASLSYNGDIQKNSFKSTIFICPERFDILKLKNNCAEILHVGTIGEHAQFEVENLSANLLLFSNCNGESTNVALRGLRPIDPAVASVCIVNSERIVRLNDQGVFNAFSRIKRYKHSPSDLQETKKGLLGLEGRQC